ncbi:pickpocket protein 28-like [Musca vetustissima]|uniref:pickpocket protein 28-like n=1 Tax=Musca vetustissima TaxID=27455 RepID=UPI002AB7E880|nr:pickpocket protein 28-like [Musca vetustissima]
MDWSVKENNLSRYNNKKLSESKVINYDQPPPNYSSDEDNICTKEAVKRNIKDYLENTTLHGLKYIAEDKITISERVFFGLAFVCVVIVSGFFISNVYVKWSATPIIISTSSKQTLSTEVPFPAITICNLNQAQKSKVQNIPKTSSNFSLLMSLCDQEANDVVMTYLGFWKYFKAILIEVAQPCDRMLLFCSFGSLVENCSNIFDSVLTDDGLCCTFNALDSKFLLLNYSEENSLIPNSDSHYVAIDWTPDKGYPKDLPLHYYPRVSGGTGSRMGLTVVLNVSSSEYYCSKTKCVGFKVLVHNPAELPKISNYGFLMTAGREARIPIEPIYQDAVDSIRYIKKSVRRCLFSDEGDLVYYRTYSRKNCELECEAKILMKKCSCVLYYLPRIDPTVPICGPNDNRCTTQVQSEIESSNKSASCDSCLPGCFELNYRTTLTSSSMVLGDFRTSDDFPPGIFTPDTKISDLSIMHFYYLSNTFRGTTKSEMFGFTEFLSNTGGLLGLFMGFSIFSIIEIVYYITVRPYCAARSIELEKRRRQNEIKWLTKDSYKMDVSATDLKKKNWVKRVRKTHRKYQKNLRNMFTKSRSIPNADGQVYPYIE